MAKEESKMSTNFNPDEFLLKKDDVTDFINIVLEYWSRSFKAKLGNAKLIGSLEMMKLGVKFTDEDDFKMIWSMLLEFINQLQYENAMQHMKKDGGNEKFNFGETVSKLKSELRDGGLEKMLEKFQK